MKIAEKLFNVVFSFGGFVAIAGILIVFIFGTLIRQEYAEKALTEATIKACYDGGLIKVDTDAGVYCVSPANLVKVK